MTLGLAGSAAASTPTAPTSTSHSAPNQFQIRPLGIPSGPTAANIPVVINHSSQPLKIISLAVNNGWTTAYWVGPGPFDGLVIAPNSGLYVTWLERIDSEIDLTYQSTLSPSSTVTTSTGYNAISGWAYGCNAATGVLECDDNGTNPDSNDSNVTIDNS